MEQQRFCTGCGSPITSQMKLCPQCGRVVAQPRPAPQQPVRRPVQRQQAAPQQQRRPVQRGSAAPVGTAPRPRPRTRPQPEPMPRRRAEIDEEQEEKRARSAGTARAMRIVFKVVKTAVIIAVIYAVIYFVQIGRVKLATYPFKSDMKMTYSTYGTAMSHYFEEGKWSVNPFTGTCTYTGQSKHDEQYEIVFTVRLSVKVKSITVDGEPVKRKNIESRVMGMFI